MQSKIDSVLSSESKADAMLVEARDEGEKLLLSTRKTIEQEREKLSEEIVEKKNKTLKEAQKSAQAEVAKLKEAEKEDAAKIEKSGKGNVKAASKLILTALMDFASPE